MLSYRKKLERVRELEEEVMKKRKRIPCPPYRRQGILYFFSALAGTQDTVIDEVSLRPLDGGEDVVHGLRGAKSVVVDSLAFPASTLASTAMGGLSRGIQPRFSFKMCFHNVLNV